MNKEQVIEFLENKLNVEIQKEEHYKSNPVAMKIHEARANAYGIAINKVKQMEQPKQDKPAVKQCVADWYEGNEWSLEGSIFNIIVDIYNKGARTDFEKWFNASDTKPFETLIKMKLFGYTVEQPKRWVVKRADGVYVTSFNQSLLNTNIDVTSSIDFASYYKFTDLKKAEAVATLIDGSVEEV